MHHIACPEPGCSLPAEVIDHFLLDSTDRPVEHGRIVCVGGHRFLMPLDVLPTPDADPQRPPTQRTSTERTSTERTPAQPRSAGRTPSPLGDHR